MWPDATFPPKMHMLEDHVIDFISKWKVGFGIYGEQGGEALHSEFNRLNRYYCAMKPNWKRLKCIMKEHYRLIHPEARTLNPKLKPKPRKRKLSTSSEQ